ncbi:energy transducer TonB [Anaerovibrio sp.]|uniref:energy transducer TonB n=1 Tax=Anaerovibrio sp. TaxID=1872532 RepID=UPI003F14BA0E
MSAIIFRRAARPLPLSCLLHVVFLAVLAGFWGGDGFQAGRENQEAVIEVEMTGEELQKVQEIRQAVPQRPLTESGGAVYSTVSQQAAAGTQALLAAEEAAPSGDGAVAAGIGNGELAQGGRSFASGMEGGGTGDAAGDDNISTGNSPAAASQPPGEQESIADIASRFAARVEANKKYPYMAVRQGQQGVVSVYAVLSADGGLLDYGLSGSSGYDSLDKAALKAVQSSCPFSHGAGHSITITVPIHFELR